MIYITYLNNVIILKIVMHAYNITEIQYLLQPFKPLSEGCYPHFIDEETKREQVI